jgi:hypothetical protein
MSKSKKVFLAWLFRCTVAPRTLGKNLSMTRSMEEGAHRRMAEVDGEIRCRGQRSGA